MKGSVLEI